MQIAHSLCVFERSVSVWIVGREALLTFIVATGLFFHQSWRVMTCVQGLTLNEPGSVPGLNAFRCTQCVSCIFTGYLRKVHQASFISSIDLVLDSIAPGAAPESTIPKVNIRLHISSECPAKALMPGVSFSCSKVAVLTSMINVMYNTTFATVLFSGAQTPSPLWSFGLRQPTTDLLLESSDQQPLVLHAFATNNSRCWRINIHICFVWANTWEQHNHF